jgi:recombination protein RecR
MSLLPVVVQNLIDQFAKLPGVGPRSAERLTFFVLRDPGSVANGLGNALLALDGSLVYCDQCHNLAEESICVICANDKRDRTLLAIIEEPLDVVAIENTGHYRGLYHVLGGVISPLDGIGPDKLNIKDLTTRIEANGVKEIILATNPSTEGEATAMYIKRLLAESPVEVSRLARGLPVGGDLEYADQVTLGRALTGRQAF